MRSTPASTPTTPANQRLLDYRGVNALAESFVDSFKTELIRDRVWQTRSQLELAIVEYVAWFNTTRLHGSLGDIPPDEHEARHAIYAAVLSHQ